MPEPDTTPIVLETPRLRLEPFAEAHLTERYVRWLGDPAVMKYSEQRFRTHTLACNLHQAELGKRQNSMLRAIAFHLFLHFIENEFFTVHATHVNKINYHNSSHIA